MDHRNAVLACVLFTLLGLFSTISLSDARAAEGAQLTPILTPEERGIPMDFTFQDKQGASVRLKDFRGQVVMVNFWATWCAPCVAEMPALDRLQADLGPDGLEVLTLSQDRGGPFQVDRFFTDNALTHMVPYFDDKGATGRTLGVRALPTTLIFDRQGRQAVRHLGVADWDAGHVREILEGMLAEAGPDQDSPSALPEQQQTWLSNN